MKRTPPSAFMMPFPVHFRTAPHRLVLLLLHMGHVAQKAYSAHIHPYSAPSIDALPVCAFIRGGTSYLALPRSCFPHAVPRSLGQFNIRSALQCMCNCAEGIKQLRHLVQAEADLVARDDMVAWLDACDALSHTLHDACGLMAQDAGEEALRVCERRVFELQKGAICMSLSMTVAAASASLRRALCSLSCSTAPELLSISGIIDAEHCNATCSVPSQTAARQSQSKMTRALWCAATLGY